MLTDRIITNVVRAGRFAMNSTPYIKSVADPALKKAGSIIGNGGVAGFQGFDLTADIVFSCSGVISNQNFAHFLASLPVIPLHYSAEWLDREFPIGYPSIN